MSFTLASRPNSSATNRTPSENLFEKNLSMEKTLEISLYNANKALRKIKEGKYGICEKCGEPISPERLEAFPSATSCMKCKEKSL